LKSSVINFHIRQEVDIENLNAENFYV